MLSNIIAAGSPPAGGAAIGQVIGATLGAMVATAGLIWIIMAHRSGRISWVGKLAAQAETRLGAAGWASLPSALIGGSLLIAVFGMYWDISIHIDKGRDPGPLANPAHYFILVGLFGVFFCGIVSIALAKDKPSDVATRLAPGWWAPLGALMILVCGTVSLIAFPLDDVWHRIFGQDVTLWGPTHLLLFGGASFSILGIWVLQVEAARARGGDVAPRTLLQRFRDLSLAGALLIGMSTFQGEFDFGVPQFQLLWQPVLIALAAGIALVAARVRYGRGGALAAVAFFIGLRGFLAIMVGPVIGETTPHFPLYIVEALCVEAVALRFGRSRPITLGAVSGVLIGTLGFFAEYAWSHVWMVNPWPSSLIGTALPLAAITGVGAGILGGAIGRAVTPSAANERVPRWVVPAGGIAVLAVIVFCAPQPTPSNPPKATVTLTDTGGAPRHAFVTVKLDPPDAAKDARWLNVTAWQGGGKVVNALKQIGPGTYRSTQALPLYGSSWKSTLRLQTGRSVLGLPIYMPADAAIPVKGVPAPAHFTRPFEQDQKLLQREQKKGVSPVLKTVAYGAVLLIALIVAALLIVGLRKIARAMRGGDSAPPREKQTAPRVATAT
ncbi:MAG: hypothetical protein QOF37_1001 [Thermoleophilaceae bacterium]|nr:hypothetical protein [Thermoleophilaceae bacterium]